MKKTSNNKPSHVIAQIRVGLGLSPEDADFLLGWEIKTWKNRECSREITDSDLDILSERANESDCSIADPKELKTARERFGLSAQQCDRLLGKTTTWWGNHERGVVKTYRFYVDALISRASKPVDQNLSAEQLKVSDFLASERMRVGMTAIDLTKFFAGKIRRWDRLESYGFATEAELKLIKSKLSKIPTIEQQEFASPDEIKAARLDAGFSMLSASKLLAKPLPWWANRERNGVLMKRSDLDCFIEKANIANATKPKMASQDQIKVARFCSGLTQLEAATILGKREHWWRDCEYGLVKMTMGLLLTFVRKMGLPDECLNSQLPVRPVDSSELRLVRLALGLSIKAAAALMGENFNHWNRRERGQCKTEPSFITAFTEAARALLETKPKMASPSEIKAARLCLNMSQREISKHLNKVSNWWSGRERGVCQMSESQLDSYIEAARKAKRRLQCLRPTKDMERQSSRPN